MRSRRLLFVVVVAALLAGALAAGHASSGGGAPAPPAPARDAATVAAGGVWFCPGLPPTLPRTSARVTFANVGATPADLAVTVLADKGAVTHASLTVPPRTVVTRPRDRLGAPGALTVEAFGGRVVVEEGIDDPHALAGAPCATATSAHWYFGAGTTPRGVQQWLVIDNPYASDARVDVTLRTGSGVRRPDALQGLGIARRSRVVIAVHDYAVREDRVAVAVDAEVGTVVASQALVFGPDAGAPGVALALGSPAATTDAGFAGGIAPARSTVLVAIANVGDDDAQVDVQATAEPARTVLAPVSLRVAQDDVVWVGLGDCPVPGTKACIAIADGTRYALDVHSEQNVAVVAQLLGRLGAPDLTGTVTLPGTSAPARVWTFAHSRASAERATTVSLANPGAAPAVVDVGLVHDGTVDRPRGLQGVTIRPGGAVTLVVVGGARPSRADAAITVVASEPVVAERTIVAAHEASTSTGAAG